MQINPTGCTITCRKRYYMSPVDPLPETRIHEDRELPHEGTHTRQDSPCRARLQMTSQTSQLGLKPCWESVWLPMKQFRLQ